MSLLLTDAASVSFAIVADMELPRTTSIYARVVAIQKRYHQLTGRWLEAMEAVRILDRLNVERDDAPIPTRFSRVAEYLRAHNYATEDIHEITAFLARHNRVAGCALLSWDDRPAIENLLPIKG